ncbi:sensor of ECF-type sigma factor [Psychroserpens sp. XS_ASV72]|uniref:sensor of ECF-type sigma factor n=1 Tax=Psychroserpens sp. XS_ASV72 TaxID=3241293 RepID=UPI0035165746
MKPIITILFFVLSLSTFGQPEGRMKERIKSQKIAFITEKLSLTSEEAEKFWPIYNAFEETTEEVRRNDLKDIKREMRNNSNMSDKDADKLLERLTAAEDKMHNAKKNLIRELKGVIPSKKIILLKAAEDEFNRKLLERLKDFKDRRGR